MMQNLKCILFIAFFFKKVFGIMQKKPLEIELNTNYTLSVYDLGVSSTSLFALSFVAPPCIEWLYRAPKTHPFLMLRRAENK